MAKESMKSKTAATKIALGEVVEFEDIALTSAETRFGQTTIVNFANSDGVIIRKCFAQGGLLEFLKANPEARTVTLKKKLVDGDYTYNVWSQ